MKIGIIVAIKDEEASVRQCLSEVAGNPVSVDSYVGGPCVKTYDAGKHIIHFVRSGAGEIYAASTTQLLISRYGVQLIINLGVCGGLTDGMKSSAAVVVEKVVHYDFDTSAVDGCTPCKYEDYPDIYIPAWPMALSFAPQRLEKVICASGDKFMRDEEMRRELHERYGAEICDMEAAGILLTANRARVPALLVKVVSDSVKGGVDEYRRTVKEAADICAEILKNITGGKI